MEQRLGLLGLNLCIVILAATLSTRFEGGQWFLLLAKPAWTPPAPVFAAGWAITWVLMAMAAWRAARHGAQGLGLALFAWACALVLILAWSWLVFGVHRPGWSLTAGGLLVAALGAAAFLFGRRDGMAGLLLLPTLAWTAFIWVQNLAWWRLSGGGLGTILG